MRSAPEFAEGEGAIGRASARQSLGDRVRRYPQPVIIIAAVVLSIVGLIALREVAAFVTPVFLALNLVLAIAPFFHWMMRKRVPKILAGIVAALTVYAILFAFVWLLIWSVVMLIQELPKYGAQFNNLYVGLLEWLSSFGLTQDMLLVQLQNMFNPAAIVSLLQNLLSNFGGVMSLFATLVIVIFFLFFDAITFEPRMNKVREARPTVGAAFDSFSTGVARYWIVTTIFGLIVAVLDVFALEILGVPLALVWGVFSFLTNYIPNIGFVIGMIPPVLMALLANGWVNALIVLAVWSIINFVIQSLIQPRFAGEAVGVTPTISFLSLIVWAYALGPVGALLALPATLLVKAILVDANPGARWVNYVIDFNPQLDNAELEAEDLENADRGRSAPESETPQNEAPANEAPQNEMAENEAPQTEAQDKGSQTPPNSPS